MICAYNHLMRLSKNAEIAVQVALRDANARGNAYATLEHLLFALLLDDDCEKIVKHCGGDIDAIREKLSDFLDEESEDEQADDVTTRPSLGFDRVVQRAAMHAMSASKDEVQSANLLIAIFAEEDSHARFFLEDIGVTRLDVVSYISHGISKLEGVDATHGLEDEDEEGTPNLENVLEQFCENLTEQAEDNELDKVIGRGIELDRTIQILARRTKNNPLFVGDPGVGKTALAEGLAQRVAAGNVPQQLQGASIYSLDMAALLAGTRYRGDFEKRFKAVVKALEQQSPAVLFIDEIHTIVGAGATSGSAMDAANLLKPILAKGGLRCLGSTTYQEYRSRFEKDAALSRRFQKVDVKAPTEEQAIEILAGLRERYENFHKVKYTDDALEAAVKESVRHLYERQLPDKAIDVLDESGAKARIAEDKKNVVVERSGEEAAADTRVEKEPATDSENERAQWPVVDKEAIELTIATMAKIPPKKVAGDDRDRLQKLDDELKTKVFHQDHAVDEVVAAIRLGRAGLRTPGKPIGSFLFTGPTGVGKTELAKQLSEQLSLNFIRFDMSEYMERHTVSRLIGAPPGYVGYERGGLLTDAVHQTPHSLLLLDEIEKAHPDIYNILLQVMDHGRLTDNNGRETDFSNVILIMTSNLGARELSSNQIGFGGGKRDGADQKAFERFFSPEFRNRLDARVAFNALPESAMEAIVDKFLSQLKRQLADKQVELDITADALSWLARRGYDDVLGARPMERVIQEFVKKPLAEAMLFGELKDGGKAELVYSETDIENAVGRQSVKGSILLKAK